MNRRIVLLCALLVLIALGAGCNQILGDFDLGVESADGGEDDATVTDGAGPGPVGNAMDGQSSTSDATSRGDAKAPNRADASGDATLDGSKPPGEGGGGPTTLDAGEEPPPEITCTPGGSCTPGDCMNGTWGCVDGGRVCHETTAFEAGTPCGAGGDAGASVCNAGACVSCNAGGDCSDPKTNCVKKSYDCTSGMAVCKVAGTVSDGVSCDAGLYCNGGTCAACQVGTSCPPAANACHVGKVTACTGAVATCTDQGASAPAGTSCTVAGASSGVCDGSGACVACSPGAQCTPSGNPCQVGVQACSAGVQCTKPVAVHEGQACGTGLVCHSGACSACNGTTCASGCCDSHGCVTTTQTATECGTGIGGGVCKSCPGPTGGAATGSAACVGNACTLSCAAGTTSCNGACLTLKSDDNNCGTCGHACAAGSHCNASGACICVPTANPCGGSTCGSAPDGCGGTVSCGTCTAPTVCSNTSGGPGTCGCTATTTCKSLGATCGSFVDSCNVTQNCGSCTAPDTCAAGANGAGTCSCKATDSCASHGYTCGSFTDTCGNTPSCGSCTAPQTCSGAAGTCSCTAKKTCASLKATCGSFVDDCGVMQNCGTCASGAGTCTGSPGTCGGCNTAACGTSKCGSISEGTNCPTANCGTCASPLTCSTTSGPGSCVCASGTTKCGTSCVNTATDPNNCGGCGIPCGSGLHCVAGNCTCDVTSCSGCCVGNSCSSPKPVWYPDNDGDGYGDENAASKGVTVSSCTLPPPNAMVSKFVLDHSDCCDADPIANPGYLAAHAGNPWMLAPDACGDYLWNCEPNKVPVVEFPPLPLCSTTWQTCINNSQTNPTCATDGCASLCIGTPPQCTDIGSGTAACGFSILANYYQCNLDSTGTMCSAGIGNSIYGVQGCY